MKKTETNTEKKSRQEIIRELTDGLEESIKGFMEGEKYKNFLTKMSQFHNYSLNNQLLIAIQRPGATLCASYTGWKKQERQVKKGEKGIKIICPAPYKKQALQDKKDPQTGKPVLMADGSPRQEIVEVIIPAFKVGYTFDVSQTEGKPLPEITQNLEGNLTDSQKDLRQALLEICPVPVSFQPVQGAANGFYRRDTKEIVVDDSLSETHSLKTLIHEMSHALLHSTDIPDAPKDSPTREVQAESVACVVCSYFGIDTSDYSFGYISGWSSGKDTKELKASLEVIRNTSNVIITKAEETLTRMKMPKQEISETIQKGRCR